MLFLKLLKKEIKYKIGLAILFYIIYVILFYTSQRAVAQNELIISVITLIAASTIWGAEQSMDIILLTGAGLKKIMVARWIALVLSLCLLPGLHTLIFSSEQTRLRYTLIYTITILFMCSLSVLVRTIVNNSMGAVIFSFAFTTLLIYPSLIFGEIGTKISSSPFYPLRAYSIAQDSDFICNRVVVCVMSLCLIGLAYLILWHKEKKIAQINE